MKTGKAMVVRAAEANSISIQGGMIRDYPSKEATEKLGVAVARIDGVHGPTKNSKNARAYYILCGQASISLDGESHEVSVGDVVVIPENTWHRVEGRIEYVVINAPTFDPAFEIKP